MTGHRLCGDYQEAHLLTTCTYRELYFSGGLDQAAVFLKATEVGARGGRFLAGCGGGDSLVGFNIQGFRPIHCAAGCAVAESFLAFSVWKAIFGLLLFPTTMKYTCILWPKKGVESASPLAAPI